MRTTKGAEEHGTALISSSERRRFLGSLSGLTAAALTGGAFGLDLTLVGPSAVLEAAEIGPLNAHQRRNEAYEVRHKVALNQKNLPLTEHPDNGDESLYANKIGSYSKALPHNSL